MLQDLLKWIKQYTKLSNPQKYKFMERLQKIGNKVSLNSNLKTWMKVMYKTNIFIIMGLINMLERCKVMNVVKSKSAKPCKMETSWVSKKGNLWGLIINDHNKIYLLKIYFWKIYKTCVNYWVIVKKNRTDKRVSYNFLQDTHACHRVNREKWYFMWH